MAVILGHTYPEIFSGVGVHSGLPFGSANNVASAFTAMSGQAPQPTSQTSGQSVRTIVFHGTADATVNPANGASIAQSVERSGPDQTIQQTRPGSADGRSFHVSVSAEANRPAHLEHWVIDGLGHAWSGGKAGGSYTDPKGPDASAEMVRFFFGQEG